MNEHQFPMHSSLFIHNLHSRTCIG